MFFSRLLPERHSTLWKQLKGIFCKFHIPVGLIEGTRDIWARDYCPVQVGPRRSVKFRYFPDYLHGQDI